MADQGREVEAVQRDGFSYCVQPNRSLTLRGRVLWLGIIAVNAMLIGTAAALVGAWPVLPFAGIEVLLVAAAFYVVGLHDADIERLQVRDGRFEWQRRDGSRVSELAGNVAWARFDCVQRGAGITIMLRYAGRCVELGQGLTISQRWALAKTVRTVFVGSIA